MLYYAVACCAVLCYVVLCYAEVSYVVNWLALPRRAEPRCVVVICFVVAFTMRYSSMCLHVRVCVGGGRVWVWMCV